MVQLSGPPSNDPWRLKMPGYLRRARVHSVFSFQSDGRGKSSYSMARYSRKGFWACNAPQEPRPASASITTARKRIHTLRQDQHNTAFLQVRLRNTLPFLRGSVGAKGSGSLSAA